MTPNGMNGGARADMSQTSHTLRIQSTTAALARVVGGLSGVAVENIADAMVDRMLAPRREFLNGRKPKSTAIHQLRRDIATKSKAKPMHQLVRVLFADAEEPDMPFGAPSLVLRVLADMLDARQHEVRHEGVDAPSLLPLIERENAREYAGDKGERRLLTDEDSVEAIDAALEQKAREREADEALCDALRQKRARLTLAVAR